MKLNTNNKDEEEDDDEEDDDEEEEEDDDNDGERSGEKEDTNVREEEYEDELNSKKLIGFNIFLVNLGIVMESIKLIDDGYITCIKFNQLVRTFEDDKHNLIKLINRLYEPFIHDVEDDEELIMNNITEHFKNNNISAKDKDETQIVIVKNKLIEEIKYNYNENYN